MPKNITKQGGTMKKIVCGISGNVALAIKMACSM